MQAVEWRLNRGSRELVAAVELHVADVERTLHCQPTFLILKHEVLGRTNRLLSLIGQGPHRKRRDQQFLYCCACIHCRGNVFTEPMPSNDRRDTHTDM
jgi:hypothetical protein